MYLKKNQKNLKIAKRKATPTKKRRRTMDLVL